jgi:hypothetical protein
VAMQTLVMRKHKLSSYPAMQWSLVYEHRNHVCT